MSTALVLILLVVVGFFIWVWYGNQSTITPLMTGAVTNIWNNLGGSVGGWLASATGGLIGGTPNAQAKTSTPTGTPASNGTQAQITTNQNPNLMTNTIHPLGTSVDQSGASPVFYFCPDHSVTLGGANAAEVIDSFTNKFLSSSSPPSIQVGQCAFWTLNQFPNGLTPLKSGSTYQFLILTTEQSNYQYQLTFTAK